MNRKSGLYISFEGKNILRRVFSMTGETELPPITVAEEIIGLSELEMRNYIKIIEWLPDFSSAQRSCFDTFDDFYIAACSVLEKIEDFNILYGTLIRNRIFKGMTPDDGTKEYFLQTKKNFIYGLSEIIDINYTINDILEKIYLGKEIDLIFTYKKYAETCCTHYFSMGEELKEELDFDSLQNYFSFLMMKFLSSKPNVVLCQYCGKFFIPKTKKETFYCDRVIKNGRTCKQLAPAQKHLVQAKENMVVKAFDTNKKKMYKRYERTKDSLHETEKSLTLSEYYDWLSIAERARSDFLKGVIGEEEALGVICV